MSRSLPLLQPSASTLPLGSLEPDAVGTGDDHGVWSGVYEETDRRSKVAAHENSAHEKRNWVRLSYDCNNRCTFCLDTNAHDGTMRADRDIRVQIVEGRKKGATRLILSGGEPTMHPLFLEYVALGKRAGYRRIQTVTNGRMFSYPDFLEKAAANGLHEITFSLHGHTAQIHDPLVGTPGAFEQETRGLKAALASGKFIINIDIVINKRNVKHLPEMLDTFISWGVQEFDLLHVIPFGNAWTEARHHLFYDLDEHAEVLRKAFSYSHRPDIHVWLNRFPPQYTEGYEELIQDPYKLNDEVRGRREEFDAYLSVGRKLMCREPERCNVCYLQDLCDSLDVALATRRLPKVEEIRLDRSAPLSGKLPPTDRLHVVAANYSEATKLAAQVEFSELSLDLDNPESIPQELDGSIKLARVWARDSKQLQNLLATAHSFDVVALLTKDMAAALLTLPSWPNRLVLRQPNYDRVTDNHDNDVSFTEFFSKLRERFSDATIRTENIPKCLSGCSNEKRLQQLDGGMLASDARIDMGKYAQRYVADGFYTKSLRCKTCSENSNCPGVHINWVRAHGYSVLDPIK